MHDVAMPFCDFLHMNLSSAYDIHDYVFLPVNKFGTYLRLIMLSHKWVCLSIFDLTLQGSKICWFGQSVIISGHNFFSEFVNKHLQNVKMSWIYNTIEQK